MSFDVPAFLRLTMLATVFIVPVAHAQTPAAALDEDAATTSVMSAPAPQADADTAEEDSTSADGDNWELCPEPMDALNQVPGQLEELQADIDRYTLCLNRAELLMKLEDLKNQNREKEMGSQMGASGLPSLSPPPLNPAQTAELLGADKAAVEAPGSVSIPAAPVPQLGYTIKEIRGTGGSLTARLVTPAGTVEQVRVGDTLDDGSKVTSISSTQVIISKENKTDRLSWAN